MKKRSTNKRGRMMTVQQFRASFWDEQKCGEQLSRQRWPEGFKCPRCGGPSRGYMAERQVHECARCAYLSEAELRRLKVALDDNWLRKRIGGPPSRSGP